VRVGPQRLHVEFLSCNDTPVGISILNIREMTGAKLAPSPHSWPSARSSWRRSRSETRAAYLIQPLNSQGQRKPDPQGEVSFAVLVKPTRRQSLSWLTATIPTLRHLLPEMSPDCGNTKNEDVPYFPYTLPRLVSQVVLAKFSKFRSEPSFLNGVIRLLNPVLVA